MQSVIYIDMLFLINSLIGYFTLRAAASLCKCECITIRLILAAILAGFSSFIIFFQGLPSLAIWVYKITTCILICTTAFKILNLRMLLKRVFWYIFLNITLAGIVFAAIYYLNIQGMQSNNLAVYFNISPPVLILCVVAVYLCVKLSGTFFGAPSSAQMAIISFKVMQRQCSCVALVDTGFNVKDLFGGKKAFMLSLPCIKEQLPKTITDDLNAYFNGEIPQGATLFYIVSVHTASGAKALPAIKITDLRVKLPHKIITHADAAAVFTNECIGSNEFEAIIGHDFAG